MWWKWASSGPDVGGFSFHQICFQFERQSNADLIFLKFDKELESPSWNVCKMQLFAFLCFTAAESAEVMVIPDDDSSSNSDSNSDSSMVSIDSSLSSVLSVDTDSSIHLESSSPYSGYSDDSSDEDED